MSSDGIYSFASVYLGLAPRQRSNFLAHITKKHCEYIRQSTSMQLGQSDRDYLRRNSTAIKKRASKRVCLGDKRRILTKKAQLITGIFQIVIRYIEEQRQAVV